MLQQGRKKCSRTQEGAEGFATVIKNVLFNFTFRLCYSASKLSFQEEDLQNCGPILLESLGGCYQRCAA